MKFLRLPVKFKEGDSEEIERMESLGLKYETKLSDGILYVNPTQIISFNESSEKKLVLSMTDKDFLVEINIKDFLELMKEV